MKKFYLLKKQTKDLVLQPQVQNDTGKISYRPNNKSNSPKPTNPRAEYQQLNICEIGHGVCKQEVYPACQQCYCYLCYNHLDKRICTNDHQTEDDSTKTVNPIKASKTSKKTSLINTSICLLPESFEVDNPEKRVLQKVLH